MLKDFERLYIWRERRRFFSPKEILIVLPKEIDIPSFKAFWNEQGRAAFSSFKKYVEYFGGRIANSEEELPVIDPGEASDLERAAREWLEKGIDTKKIGTNEYMPIEDLIAENERKLRNE